MQHSDEELMKRRICPEQPEIDDDSDAEDVINLYGSGPLPIGPRAEET